MFVYFDRVKEYVWYVVVVIYLVEDVVEDVVCEVFVFDFGDY